MTPDPFIRPSFRGDKGSGITRPFATDLAFSWRIDYDNQGSNPNRPDRNSSCERSTFVREPRRKPVRRESGIHDAPLYCLSLTRSIRVHLGRITDPGHGNVARP